MLAESTASIDESDGYASSDQEVRLDSLEALELSEAEYSDGASDSGLEDQTGSFKLDETWRSREDETLISRGSGTTSVMEKAGEDKRKLMRNFVNFRFTPIKQHNGFSILQWNVRCTTLPHNYKINLEAQRYGMVKICYLKVFVTNG